MLSFRNWNCAVFRDFAHAQFFFLCASRWNPSFILRRADRNAWNNWVQHMDWPVFGRTLVTETEVIVAYCPRIVGGLVFWRYMSHASNTLWYHFFNRGLHRIGISLTCEILQETPRFVGNNSMIVKTECVGKNKSCWKSECSIQLFLHCFIMSFHVPLNCQNIYTYHPAIKHGNRYPLVI